MRCQQISRTEIVGSLVMYNSLKQALEHVNGTPAEYDRYLYHECARPNVEGIVADGLNRSHCQSRGTPLLFF